MPRSAPADRLLRQRSERPRAAAAAEAPELLAACFSASAMWTANAATVTPASDSADTKVHFTPANLISKFHRSLEADQTAALLRAIFADDDHFQHHDPLPRVDVFGDEGAANHCRLGLEHGGRGLHLFVYGRDGLNTTPVPTQFPARQTRQASEAVCRRHGLDSKQVVFAQQSPAAIDAGVFHNDVIAASNLDVLFYHEQAYVDTPGVIEPSEQGLRYVDRQTAAPHRGQNRRTAADLALSAPICSTASWCRTRMAARFSCLPRNASARPTFAPISPDCWARADCPFDAVEFVEVNQSMRNGGGPACLRLRVVLTAEQLHALQGNVLLTDELYEQVRVMIGAHLSRSSRPGRPGGSDLRQEVPNGRRPNV